MDKTQIILVIGFGLIVYSIERVNANVKELSDLVDDLFTPKETGDR